jgi:hypothetical protein
MGGRAGGAGWCCKPIASAIGAPNKTLFYLTFIVERAILATSTSIPG